MLLPAAALVPQPEHVAPLGDAVEKVERAMVGTPEPGGARQHHVAGLVVDDPRPAPAPVPADAEASPAFEHEQADQVPVPRAVHVRRDPGLARLVDLEHQVVEDQWTLEGTGGHGGDPSVPHRLVVPGQVAKPAVGPESVVHTHALANEPVTSADDGGGFAIRGGARLLEQPRAVRAGQRGHRDRVLALQPVEHLDDIDTRLDEAACGRVPARLAGGESSIHRVTAERRSRCNRTCRRAEGAGSGVVGRERRRTQAIRGERREVDR